MADDLSADRVALALPSDPQKRNKFLADEARMRVRNTIIKYSLDPKTGEYNRPHPTPEQYQDLLVVTRALCNIEGLTQELVNQIGLKKILDTMINLDKIRVPDELKEIARAGWNRYENENWGMAESATLGDDEEAVEDETPISPTTPSAPLSDATSTSNGRYVTLPSANHPIFGRNGIMHGILINRGGKAKSYLFGRPHFFCIF
jgi:hypothetical protein